MSACSAPERLPFLELRFELLLVGARLGELLRELLLGQARFLSFSLTSPMRSRSGPEVLLDREPLLLGFTQLVSVASSASRAAASACSF